MQLVSEIITLLDRLHLKHEIPELQAVRDLLQQIQCGLILLLKESLEESMDNIRSLNKSPPYYILTLNDLFYVGQNLETDKYFYKKIASNHDESITVLWQHFYVDDMNTEFFRELTLDDQQIITQQYHHYFLTEADVHPKIVIIKTCLESLLHDNCNILYSYFAESVHAISIFLAQFHPLNEEDPFYFEPINPENRIFVSTGYQFDIKNLLTFHQQRMAQSDESEQLKWLLNPATLQKFNKKDIEHIQKFAKEKDLEMPPVREDNQSSLNDFDLSSSDEDKSDESNKDPFNQDNFSKKKSPFCFPSFFSFFSNSDKTSINKNSPPAMPALNSNQAK